MLQSGWLAITIFTILQIVPSVPSYKACPYEESRFDGTRIKAKWISEAGVPNQVVMSVPACLDNDNTLVTRFCDNGSWVPKRTPFCRREMENLCPDKYKLIDGYCVENASLFLIEEKDSLDVRYFPKSAKKYNCESRCLPSDLGCFCKSANCETLAVIKSSQDKKIIEELADGEVCQIGESKPMKGLRLFINCTTISYSTYTSDCAICLEQAQTFETKLTLSFEEKKHKLYLLVYAPEGLIHDNQEPLILCFTNAAQDNIKRSEIEIVGKRSEELSLVIYKIEMEKYMGEYWCEAFFLNESVVSSNRVVAYDKRKGNEYALKIIDRDIFQYPSSPSVCDYFEELLKDFDAEVRLMESSDFEGALLHISTGTEGNVVSEYPHLLETILHRLPSSVKMKYLRSSEFCLPDETKGLSWPLTKINNAVLSDEPCLLTDRTPLVRYCQGSFLYGAKWSQITETCVRNSTLPPVTRALRKLSKSDTISGENVWTSIKDEALTLLDMYYLGVILSKFQQNDSEYALDIVSKMMTTEEETLKMSQDFLNLTDIVLESIDDILSTKTFDPERIYCIRKNNLIVHINNPFLTNITGFIVYGNENLSLGELSIKDFSSGDEFDDSEKENILLGVRFPETLLEHVLSEAESNVSDVSLITVIFRNDSLFVDDNFQSRSFVVSISIPGYGSYLKTPVPITFRSRNSRNASNSCGFWDYGRRINHKKGEWSLLGGIHHSNYRNLHTCSYVHLTHFALLVMSDKKVVVNSDGESIYDLEEASEYIYEIITATGCSLSIFGICGIFVTAILFEKWRRKTGTKILQNLAVAILLEIVCVYSTEITNVRSSPQGCKITGMALHYVVLSKFCWMLVYALLQYYRFVRVVGAIPENLVLKSVIFGWGFPLIVVFLAGLSDQSYASVTYQLCYPRGALLYLAVLLPMGLIIAANLTVFVTVMYNVTKTTARDDAKAVKLRVYLAFLLFSTLGVPWIVAILAETVEVSAVRVTLFVLFCGTATLQGFVMFLFYVVMNGETRQYWSRFVRAKIQLAR